MAAEVASGVSAASYIKLHLFGKISYVNLYSMMSNEATTLDSKMSQQWKVIYFIYVGFNTFNLIDPLWKRKDPIFRCSCMSRKLKRLLIDVPITDGQVSQLTTTLLFKYFYDVDSFNLRFFMNKLFRSLDRATGGKVRDCRLVGILTTKIPTLISKPSGLTPIVEVPSRVPLDDLRTICQIIIYGCPRIKKRLSDNNNFDASDI